MFRKTTAMCDLRLFTHVPKTERPITLYYYYLLLLFFNWIFSTVRALMREMKFVPGNTKLGGKASHLMQTRASEQFAQLNS